MILTKSEILKEIEAGNIVIKDFNPNNLNPNSLDVTLYPKLKVYNETILDPKKQNSFIEVDIPEDGAVLHPGQLYLARTNEWTEAHKHVPLIEGKSSLGRLGLACHITAGFGDVGFCGYFVLELAVIKPIRIYPNMRIAQLVWHDVKGTIEPYAGKYQKQGSIIESKSHEDPAKGKF